jgi:CRP-like cAMP-binding protein
MEKPQCAKCHTVHKSIFCDLETKAHSQIDQAKTFLTYTKGDVLFHQGEHVSGVYCIKTGKAKATIADSLGNETIAKILGPGAVLGHRSMLSNSDHIATVEFLEEASVCFVDKTSFQKIIQDNPSLALTLGQRLAQEVVEADGKNLALVHHSVKERVCALLLNLSHMYGIKTQDGIEIDIKLTREEMASIVGTTPETMIRTLSNLKDEQVIVQNGKKLVILNQELLTDESGIY